MGRRDKDLERLPTSCVIPSRAGGAAPIIVYDPSANQAWFRAASGGTTTSAVLNNSLTPTTITSTYLTDSTVYTNNYLPCFTLSSY
jgi:hypothetical protein